MLVETSPLLGPPPPHPIAPREPKRVKCEAANTVREADYKIKLAEYQEEKTAHHLVMQERRTQQVVNGHDAVRKRTNPRIISSHAPESLRPFRDASWPWAEWVNDLEYYARRCGADQSQQLYEHGMWYDPNANRENSDYMNEDRAIQFGMSCKHALILTMSPHLKSCLRSQHGSKALVLLQLRMSSSTLLNLSATGGTIATGSYFYMSTWSLRTITLRSTLRTTALKP
jgi:hypothetical protein